VTSTRRGPRPRERGADVRTHGEPAIGRLTARDRLLTIRQAFDRTMAPRTSKSRVAGPLPTVEVVPLIAGRIRGRETALRVEVVINRPRDRPRRADAPRQGPKLKPVEIIGTAELGRRLEPWFVRRWIERHGDGNAGNGVVSLKRKGLRFRGLFSLRWRVPLIIETGKSHLEIRDAVHFLHAT